VRVLSGWVGAVLSRGRLVLMLATVAAAVAALLSCETARAQEPFGSLIVPDGSRLAFDRGGVIHVIAWDGEPGSEVPLTPGVQPTWGGGTG
jgi:hypothetical protein